MLLRRRTNVRNVSILFFTTRCINLLPDLQLYYITDKMESALALLTCLCFKLNRCCFARSFYDITNNSWIKFTALHFAYEIISIYNCANEHVVPFLDWHLSRLRGKVLAFSTWTTKYRPVSAIHVNISPINIETVTERCLHLDQSWI